MGNPFSTAKKVYYDGAQLSRIYCNGNLLYSLIEPPVEVATENLAGASAASDYEEGSTTFGSLTLSEGVTTSEDGLEISNQETFASAADANISYPMTLEFKGRIDSYTSSNPPMIWGMGKTVDTWGAGCICCYAHSNYGLIIDSNGTARKIITKMTAEYVHMVFVTNESGTPILYVNGMNHSYTYTADAACTGSKTYFYNGEGKGRFSGAINVMRWWDRNLTESEIVELFAADSDEYILAVDKPNYFDQLVYESSNIEFDGTNYVDTGIALYSQNRSYRIECVATSSKTDYGSDTQIGTLFHCMHETGNYPGMVVDTNGRGNYRCATGKNSSTSTIPTTDTNTHTFIVEYTTSNNQITFYYDTNSAVIDTSYTAISENLILGAYQTTAGTFGRYWTGTISSFKIYYSSKDE